MLISTKPASRNYASDQKCHLPIRLDSRHPFLSRSCGWLWLAPSQRQDLCYSYCNGCFCPRNLRWCKMATQRRFANPFWNIRWNNLIIEQLGQTGGSSTKSFAYIWDWVIRMPALELDLTTGRFFFKDLPRSSTMLTVSILFLKIICR